MEQVMVNTSELVSQILQGVPVNAVLRERLTLAMEQKVAAEAEAAALRGENEALARENEKLKAEVVSLKTQNTNNGEALPDEQEALLVLLSSRPDSTTETLAALLKIGVALAEFHIDELKRNRMVDGHYNAYEPTTWYLKQEGRRYLVQKGKLK